MHAIANTHSLLTLWIAHVYSMDHTLLVLFERVKTAYSVAMCVISLANRNNTVQGLF